VICAGFLAGGSGVSQVRGSIDWEASHPKIGNALYQLHQVYQARGIKAAVRFATRHGMEMRGRSVQVVAETEASGNAFELQAAVDLASLTVVDLGGTVQTTHRHLVQNMIPLGALRALAESATVRTVRLPMRPIPLATSEGVGRVGADLWHNIPVYREGGQVAKVCVLDLGFAGYQALVGTELPQNTEAVSFRADGDVAAGTGHGTACAEVIHDMAPGASLLLVNYSTDVEHHNAVDWIIGQGVDIISYSLGWLSAGAGDGTGPICADVEKAHQAGITWVSAAGNSGLQHWQGLFRDRSGDTWHEFDSQGVKDTDYLAFWVAKGDRFSVWLNWDDWGTWNGVAYTGAGGHDYDLYLYDKDFQQIAKSTYRQTKGALPVEGVSFQARAKGWRYIRVKQNSSKRNCRLELFFVNASQLEHVSPYGSVNVPADSPHAIAVGATDWSDDGAHLYSSRGPTSDMRIKPDLSAPSGVSTETYGKFSFYGTSAATAHVAGAIALLMEKTFFSREQILEILKARALDLGAQGKDNLYGGGRLKLIK
jgi:subtilisin family serine protease